MFRAHRAHHQERQIMSIQPLVAVTVCRWPCFVQVVPTNTAVILGKWPTWLTILFYVFIYIFISLHVSSTSCSSSGETNYVNTTSGSCHSVSVAVSCAGRKWILFYV